MILTLQKNHNQTLTPAFKALITALKHVKEALYRDKSDSCMYIPVQNKLIIKHWEKVVSLFHTID